MKSQWCKWLSNPGHIRVVAIEATELLKELCQQQSLTGLAQIGYAEAVVGTLLIASGHKSNESINMNAQGSGVFRQSLVDASPDGRVRGFLIEEKDTSMHTFGAAGTNGPWGTGILSILYTKNFEGKVPYTGMVPISTGYLDEAINEYYKDSEQLASQVGLSIEFDGQELQTARGCLIQAIGGAAPEELEDLAQVSQKDLRELARASGDFKKFEARASVLLKGRPLRAVDQTDLVFFCNCSQERIERALLLTGKDAIMEALGQDEVMDITCDFCKKAYKVSAERLRALFSTDPSRLQ